MFMIKTCRRLSGRVTSGAWVTLLASGAVACGHDTVHDENDGASTGAETARISQALQSGDANDLRLDFTPPNDIYMTSFSAAFQYQGVYPHTVYLYQPQASEQVIRIHLRSEIAGVGIPDTDAVFHNVRWVHHPEQPNPTEEGLSVAPEGNRYDAVSRGQGWYALKFDYRPTSSNRALIYEAFDAQGDPMRTAWVAPSGRTSKFSASFHVATPTHVYFKGAAFSGASIRQFAFA